MILSKMIIPLGKGMQGDEWASVPTTHRQGLVGVRDPSCQPLSSARRVPGWNV